MPFCILYALVYVYTTHSQIFAWIAIHTYIRKYAFSCTARLTYSDSVLSYFCKMMSKLHIPRTGLTGISYAYVSM